MSNKDLEDDKWFKEQFDKREDKIEEIMNNKEQNPRPLIEEMFSDMYKEYLKKEDETE